MRFLACLLVALVPGTAFAFGLDLTADECVTDGGVSSTTFDCSNASSYRTLYAVFSSPIGIPDLESVSAYIDIQTDEAVYPDFWSFYNATTNPTGCNAAWGVDPQPHSGACASVEAPFDSAIGGLFVGLRGPNRAIMAVAHFSMHLTRLRPRRPPWRSGSTCSCRTPARPAVDAAAAPFPPSWCGTSRNSRTQRMSLSSTSPASGRTACRCTTA